MATTQTIQIKRSTTTAAPSTTLAAGELAYSSNSSKLFIGHPDGTTGNLVIGGKLYIDYLDHTPGTLTASSAVLVDANSKIDVFNVDNLTLDGNAITSTDANGNITITPNGTGDLVLDGLNWPQADGTTGQYLTTNGTGQLSWDTVVSSFDISDGTATDTVNTGETITFTGGTAITTAVTANEVTFSVTDGSIGSTQLTNDTITIGTTGIALGGTSTTLAGLTAITVDNIQVGITTANTIDTTTGDLTLAAQSGTIVVDGNLTVTGTTTTVNSETVTLADNILLLNSNATGVPSENAGIEVERGDSTNVYLRWNETSDIWQVFEPDPNNSNTLTAANLLTTVNFETQITTIDGGTF